MAWRLRRRRDRRVTLYIDAGLRRGGWPGRVRRRAALLASADPGRVEDLCPEEHLRRRLRYYDRRPRRHAGRAGAGEEEGERVAGEGGAVRLCCRGLSVFGVGNGVSEPIAIAIYSGKPILPAILLRDASRAPRCFRKSGLAACKTLASKRPRYYYRCARRKKHRGDPRVALIVF